jgi:hypothetical protein
VTVLFAGALNSKEMGVTFPIAALAWDLTQRRRPPVALLLWTVLALAYTSSKLSPASVFHGVGGYDLAVTAERYWSNTSAFLAMLLAADRGTFGPAAVVATYAAMVATAFALRSRAMLWCALFAILAPLPVTFIPLRGLFAWYVALIGWWIWIASALVLAGRLVAVRRPAVAGMVPRLAGFALLWVALLAFHEVHRREPQSHGPVGGAIEDLRALGLRVPSHARLLLLEDRFNTDEWTPLFPARLLYWSLELVVDRVKIMPSQPACDEIAGYDLLLRDDGTAIRVVSPSGMCP